MSSLMMRHGMMHTIVHTKKNILKVFTVIRRPVVNLRQKCLLRYTQELRLVKLAMRKDGVPLKMRRKLMKRKLMKMISDNKIEIMSTEGNR